jgi:CubicO group peptidase (beta-lactamase class C family)
MSLIAKTPVPSAAAELSAEPDLIVIGHQSLADQVIQSAVQAKNFMGTVLVARGGEILLNKGYGEHRRSGRGRARRAAAWPP